MSDVERLAALAIDCGLSIHRDLGPGLLESVYETLLAAKLARAGVMWSVRSRLMSNMRGLRCARGFERICCSTGCWSWR